MPITNSRPCLLPLGEPAGTVQQPPAQTAIQATVLRRYRYVLLSVALAVSPIAGIAGDAIQTAELSPQSNESQQTPQEQRAAERERIRAEREAKRAQQRAEREAERARLKAEREAKRQAQQDALAAERARLQAERDAKIKEREAARQAQIEEQEQACKRLDTVAEKLDTVPPEVLQRRFGGGIQNPRSPALMVPYESWLLADDIFVPAFGQRYDDVASDEATKLQGVIRNCRPPTNAQGQAIADTMLFFRAFDARFQPKYLSGVQDIRRARDEISKVAQQLDELPGGAAGSEQWHALAEKTRHLQAFVGTEQRTALQASLRQAYTNSVLASHAQKAEQVVGQAQGVDGLRALMQLKAEFERDAALAGTTPDWPNVARSRQAAIIQSLNEEQQQRIDALGRGLPAIEGGVQWYSDYGQRFDESMLTTMPQLREPVSYFEHQRNKALAETRPELEMKIDRARTGAELQQLVARYILFSTDKQSADGRTLMTRVAEKSEELHKRDVLGSAADQDTEGSKALPKAQATGPTPSVMYDLVNQQLRNVAAGFRSMADSCRGGGMQNDPGLAIMCVTGKLMENSGAGEPMTITQFEKLGCAEATGKAGYNCDYLLQVSGGMQRGLPKSLASVLGQKGTARARFLQTRDGWVAFFGEQ